jgi:DNA polymerase-3 subunit delta'
MFTDIIGHQSAVTILKRAILSGRIPNAYLFVGQANVGKTFTALQLAKALNCERNAEATSPEALDCCDECDNCRAITAGSHPDFMLIRPRISVKSEEEIVDEGDEGDDSDTGPQVIEIDGSLVTTGQIEALISHASLKRVRGRRKVYLITSAETMNKEAENRLLKTLEEPPADTLLILTSANLGALLPTTISRCQTISFEAVPPAEAEAALRQRFPDCTPEQLHSVAALSGGRVGWAITMLQHPEVLGIRDSLLDLCASLPQRGTVECLRQGEALVDAAERWWLASVERDVAEKALKARRDRVLRTRMHDVLDVLISWCRDLMVVHADPDSAQVINRDRLDQLRRLAPGCRVDKCCMACAYLEDMKRQLRQNVNLRLAAEIMALRLITATRAA